MCDAGFVLASDGRCEETEVAAALATSASVEGIQGSLFVAGLADVAEAPWSVAEWAVAPRFDSPRASASVLLFG